jgi:hypothetical protein
LSYKRKRSNPKPKPNIPWVLWGFRGNPRDKKLKNPKKRCVMIKQPNSNVTNLKKKSILSKEKISKVIESFLEFYQNKGLKLHKFNRGWLILCPFHDDTNPSLGIFKDGTAYCFACRKTYKLEAVLRAYQFWVGEVGEDPELKPDLSKLKEEQWRICNYRQYLYADGERIFIRFRIDWENIQTRERRKEFYFYQPIIKGGRQVLEVVRGYVPLILYRLLEIENEQRVFWVEGEKCADLLWELGLPATTLPIGATTKPSKEFYQALIPLRGKTVYILPDNDEVGWKYAKTIKQVLSSLEVESQIIPVPNLGEKSDIADYIELELFKGKSKEEIKEEILSWTKPKERVVSFWEAMQKEKEKGMDKFIVPGLFPAKGLGLLLGRSKMGKTELLCLIIAKLLRGEDLFGRPSQKVKILWISREDTKSSIGMRLMMRGITPEELQGSLFTEEVEEEATNPKEILIKEAQKLGCQMVIVEPLLVIKELAELGIKDRLTYGAVYSVLLPLKKEAEKAGIFILGVHHFNKGKAIFKDWTDVIDGALGSTAFSAVPDSILGIGLTSSGDQSLRRVLAKGRGVWLDYLVEWVWEDFEIQGEKWTIGRYIEKEEFSPEFDLTPEQKRLVEAIKKLGEDATPKRLAQELGKTENAVKVMLHELLDKGIISRARRGCYFVSIKKQKLNFPNFPNLTNLTNFPNLANVSEKLACLPNLRSLENSGLEAKVSKVSKVSSTLEPTFLDTLTQRQGDQEEVVYVLMPESEKCPICGCEVWRVERRIYAMGKGGGTCARCDHVSWFGDFKKGQVLEGEAEVEFWLMDFSRVDGNGER